ncbi:hypothetical protein NBRC116601_11960 [Cognatishimia sp. WU-CL00825]|uniref:hypothetical protein n=1 Tax=Cognatishimia sp. WU-CL00825 TaxID=3127658 RepID=UPI003101BD35
MGPEALALVTAYFMCAVEAESRVLTPAEMHHCSELYLETKLQFLPNMDVDQFKRLTTPERAAVNRTAYDAYLTWKRDNPDLVNALKQAAKSRLHGEES